MKAKWLCIPAVVAVLMAAPAALHAQAPMGTAFTYQGQLKQASVPVDSTADFEFTLWDDPNSMDPDDQVGSMVPVNNVTIVEGLFTVVLDFGNVFTGDARWLEIAVRVPAGGGVFTTLSPRQELTPTAYAIYAETAGSLAGGITGSGTAGRIAKFTGASTIGDAVIYESGGNVGIGTNADPTEKLKVDGNIRATGKATVGPGHTNSGSYAFVAGYGNTTSGERAAIGGGSGNSAARFATVSGGGNNTASGEESTIGGGAANSASGFCATVAGGAQNSAGTSIYPYATIGGGFGNTASAPYSAVPGGGYNTAAGQYSFAAGRRAKANATGSFVWGDSTNADVVCSSSNRWVARASGGVYFYSNSGCSSGVYLVAGGNSWNAVSDRATKENFRPVDTRGILDRLAGLPVHEYKLKSQDASIRHIGPVAQDLYAAFGYGESDRAINMEDAHGIALAAIQGMHEVMEEKDAEIKALCARLEVLEALVAELARTRDGGAE